MLLAYLHHPRERGSNENFNGVVSQYFKKRKSLAGKRQANCSIHGRRERYCFKTSIQRMQRTPRGVALGVLIHPLPALVAAPLFFTWNSVPVTVHCGVGAVLNKELGFAA